MTRPPHEQFPLNSVSMIKFPTRQGIATICTESGRALYASVTPPKPLPTVEEQIGSNSILINPKYPDKRIQDNMTGVPRNITEYKLNASPKNPVRQKKCPMAPERSKWLRLEVDKLVHANILREGYHQIQMAEVDEDKTAFHIDQGIYCYTKMPFGLKNVRATYQRVVDLAFRDQIGRNLEAYVNDLVIKILGKKRENSWDTELRQEESRPIPIKLKRWIEEVEKDLFEMKSLLKELPTLTAPVEGGSLMLYLATSKEAINSVLVTDRGQELYKPEVSGRLAKWTIELGENEINYSPRTAVKGRILADYLAETMGEVEALTENRACRPEGAGSGLVLTSLGGEEHTYALRFTFSMTNNESEYEALLSGMRIAQRLRIKHLDAYLDSQLVAKQVNVSFGAHEASMQRYMELVHELANEFDFFRLTQVPRGKNKNADALSKLAALAFDHLCKNVWVEVLKEKSINEKSTVAPIEEESLNWMTPFVKFLTEGKLPTDENEKGPSLLCIGPNQAKEVLREVHEGSCALHSGYRTIAAKVMRIGYYWPTIHSDAAEILRTCQSCQHHASISRAPMIPITTAWPFSKWAIDIVGPITACLGLEIMYGATMRQVEQRILESWDPIEKALMKLLA
ncbi:uncharacterized protein [Rutidosis leptorrhynchoides]|uniref:uncharacterized protein n=1 Tax=Rutidosis leptorrhynchoides TaxID=125765 RepID=UPI003A9A4DE8